MKELNVSLSEILPFLESNQVKEINIWSEFNTKLYEVKDPPVTIIKKDYNNFPQDPEMAFSRYYAIGRDEDINVVKEKILKYSEKPVKE